MGGPIFRFLTEDHARLHALLAKAVDAQDHVDDVSFEAFREGLLRHIAIEEEIVLPASREARGGEDLPQAWRIRVEHAAIAALLDNPPSRELAAELRTILGPHHVIEEAAGMYDTCDALLAKESVAILRRMRERPPVNLPPRPARCECRTAKEALLLAGLRVARRT
jgi:hypothetical protein